jgi:hypothetical protein
VSFKERLEFYETILVSANRRSNTVSRDVSLVKSFLDHVTSNHLAITSDVLNEYLMKHYQSNSTRKRAGNEIVRFAI